VFMFCGRMFLKSFVFSILLTGLFFIGIPAVVFAMAELDMTAPTAEDWMMLVESLGGLKGASTLVIAGTLAQLVLLLSKSMVGQLAGKNQLRIVAGASLVAGVTGLMLQDVSLFAALMHSTVLASLQVFAHQFIKQESE